MCLPARSPNWCADEITLGVPFSVLRHLMWCGIRTLILSKQWIGATGAKALADAARANHKVKVLILHSCFLLKGGGYILRTLLAETTKSQGLTSLDINRSGSPFHTCVKD